MNFVIKNIRWVMLISGVLTASMFYGVFAPQPALESMFGASFNGELESIVVRSWSALVGLMGVVLLYGAFNEKHRVFCISVAAMSKIIFVSLMVIYGQAFLAATASALIMDCVVILLALLFLIAVRVHRTEV
jgi:hypothetical protein